MTATIIRHSDLAASRSLRSNLRNAFSVAYSLHAPRADAIKSFLYDSDSEVEIEVVETERGTEYRYDDRTFALAPHGIRPDERFWGVGRERRSDDPREPSDKQRDFYRDLTGFDLPAGCTMKDASRLIDHARRGLIVEALV